MVMERFNMFNNIHKALRVALYQNATLLQQTDFLDEEEVKQAEASTLQVLDLFESHAHHEDKYVNSALEKKEYWLAASFENEHVKDEALGKRVRGLFTAYRHSQSPYVKYQFGQDISIAFMDFMVFNLEHMAREEDLINKALWRHYKDDQLRAISAKIVADVPAAEIAIVARLMIKGMNGTEIREWLNEIEKHAPPAAVKALYDFAEQELPIARMKKIRQEAGLKVA